ncbi:hypothetical protein [Thiomonas sp. FB-Cd]|uniref:hypothetical protein n=1 Tax=Thiomonas sp. FB-Cd TaxID=1158292 RepID=UPI0004DEDCA2|nr:hypothetical protein [Thiomonas sp. FB-Cd]
MTPVIPDRLPVLTDIIDGEEAPACLSPVIAGQADEEKHPASALNPVAPGFSPSAGVTASPISQSAARREILKPEIDWLQSGWPDEVVAAHLRAQIAAGVPRLQEQLQADLAQRLGRELELQIRDLLAHKVDDLARELAIELQPALLDLAHAAVDAVLAPTSKAQP